MTIQEKIPKSSADDATADPLALSKLRPELSALTSSGASGKAGTAIVLLAAAVAAAVWPWQTGRLAVLAATVFYVLFGIYKLALVRLSVRRQAEIKVTPEDIEALDDDSLPVYSILIPMYREPESVKQVIDSVAQMDYPAHKKDVQLLLEEDDAATLEAAAGVKLPQGFRITRVPKSFPRTKPKACNIGLQSARGRHLVIYDAEDRPERDQLKKAVFAFSQVGPEVVCLQSRLNFYNPRQNLLTRFFAAEYCGWFDLCLPGLSAVGAVIPLGGTSNHFVTSKLVEMHGWDAYNVTEDCDLGVRIFRMGFRTRMLETTTWEEACSSLPFWIRQRTRWLKGYLQTYWVHMRHPLRTLGELGPANFLHFQILVGGINLCFLINPVFWFLAALWFVFRLKALEILFPGWVFVAGAVCLFAGNFVFAYVGAAGCYRRGYWDLVKYALLAPAYWALMSLSAWRALFQFFRNPFYWEKTRHGLFKGESL